MFYISGLTFAIHPHMLQRVLSAKNDKDLRFVTRTVYATPWYAFPGMILLGITASANKLTFHEKNQGLPAFSAYLNELMEDPSSPFKNLLGYLIVLAAIAGIMSTADSCLIGVSNTVSVDLYKGYYNKNATGRQTIYFGKFVSLVTAILAGVIAVYLHAEQLRTKKPAVLNYGTLLTFQNGILWQAFPAFMFGLWTNISKQIVTTGIVLGLTTSVILMFYQAVANGSSDVDKLWVSFHPDFASVDVSIDPLIGSFVNVAVCIIGLSLQNNTESSSDDEGGDSLNNSLLREGEDASLKSFGSLTHGKIKSYVEGMTEPFTYKRGMYLWLCLGVKVNHI